MVYAPSSAQQVLTYAVAGVLALFVEMPLANAEQYLLSPRAV